MKIIRYITILVLAYIAIALTAARLLVFYADNNIDILENYLNTNDKVNFQISEVNSNWKGLYPSLEIKINNKNINKNTNIKYPNLIDVKINIYKSIIFLKPIIKSIYAENIYYRSNLKKIIENIKLNKDSDLLKIENIQIANSNFILQHNNNIYDLKNTNIIIKNNDVYISSTIDGNKSIIADLKNVEITDEGLSNIEYRIKLNGYIDYNFKEIFNKDFLRLEKSNLDVLLIGSYKNKEFVNNKIDIRTIDKSEILFENKIIKDLNIKFIFDANYSEFFKFEIIEGSFISKNDNLYKINNLAGNYNIIEKNIIVYSHSLNINLNNLSNDYSFIKNNSFSFTGLIQRLNLPSRFNQTAPNLRETTTTTP